MWSPGNSGIESNELEDEAVKTETSLKMGMKAYQKPSSPFLCGAGKQQ